MPDEILHPEAVVPEAATEVTAAPETKEPFALQHPPVPEPLPDSKKVAAQKEKKRRMKPHSRLSPSP